VIYMQQRYYDPIAGRMLSIDPVTTDANTEGSFNRYVYANNSLFKYMDPNGRQARGIEINCTAGCNTYGSLTSNTDNTPAANRTSAQYISAMWSEVLEKGLEYYVVGITMIMPEIMARETLGATAISARVATIAKKFCGS
jgi:uncharacterized protein RhaS with RHS repeats